VLFEEMVTVHTENHNETNTKELLTAGADTLQIYHWDLEG
jgi:hypothetical protein